jgi:hypothetical protein
VIYFIHKPNEQSMKVGFSSDPMRRLATLQTGSPSWLGMYAIIPGSKTDEAKFHAALRPHRIRGEWFNDQAAISQFGRHSPDFVAWIRYFDPDERQQWFYKRVDRLTRAEAESFIAQRFRDSRRHKALLLWLLWYFEEAFPGFSMVMNVACPGLAEYVGPEFVATYMA